MGWGDSFKSLWHNASKKQQKKVAVLATGATKLATWVKDKGKQTAKQLNAKLIKTHDWMVKKTQEIIQSTKKNINSSYTWSKDKLKKGKAQAKKITHNAISAYKNIKKKFTNKVVGVVKFSCKKAKNIYQQGRDGADNVKQKEKEDNEKKDWLSKLFDVVKPTAEKSIASDYYGDVTKKDQLTFHLEKSRKERLLYYGDEYNNIEVGSYNYKAKTGIAYDKKTREWTADVFDLETGITAVSWQNKSKWGVRDENGDEALLEIDSKVDLASLSGKGRVGATWGKNKKEVIAEVDFSADLIKGKASGTLNITPKSIWDNTIARVFSLKKAPKWLDHGLKLGAEGEAGIGAGIGAEVGYKKGQFVLGAKLGFGPKLGFKLGIGFK